MTVRNPKRSLQGNLRENLMAEVTAAVERVKVEGNHTALPVLFNKLRVTVDRIVTDLGTGAPLLPPRTRWSAVRRRRKMR